MSGPRQRRQPAPLPEDLALVLIDGDNLLHRARGGRDDAGVRWLLPRLRAWRPPDVRVVLMLDGAPDPGETYRAPVAPGIESHHSGGVDADTALLRLLGARPYADRIRTVMITDDRALGDKARHLHGLVRRVDWFVEQLAGASMSATPAPTPKVPGSRPAAHVTGVGAGRPPRRAAGMVGGDPSRESDGDPEKEPWKPGRGATRKTGNPKRGHPPG